MLCAFLGRWQVHCDWTEIHCSNMQYQERGTNMVRSYLYYYFLFCCWHMHKPKRPKLPGIVFFHSLSSFYPTTSYDTLYLLDEFPHLILHFSHPDYFSTRATRATDAFWPISRLVHDEELYVRSVCFSRDGKMLVTGADDGCVRVCSPCLRRIWLMDAKY